MSLGEIVAIHIVCIWVGLIMMHLRLEVLSRRADVATKRMDILSKRIDFACKIWIPENTTDNEPIYFDQNDQSTKLSFWQMHPIITKILIFVAVLPFVFMIISFAFL